MKLSELFNPSSDHIPDPFPDPKDDIAVEAGAGPLTAVFAGGCFWCTEAVFKPLEGVIDVASGYAGGTADTATYEAVCSGATNHAEAIRIRYAPARITYGQLLKVFFAVAHDPTHLNRQGNDRGRQYRSAICVSNPRERAVAQAYITQLDAAKLFSSPIVTTLEPLETFYEAELYHQNFVARNPAQPYVAAVALPKLAKLKKTFGDRLKPE